MKLKIETLGSLGDGIAKVDGRALFVPFTLPGETINASGDIPFLSLDEVIEPSQERVEPICQHFESCGGCALQHANGSLYLDWKRQLVVDAFASEKLTPEIDDCIATEPHSRRRVTFTAQRTDEGMVLGFKQRQSSSLINIQECAILVPQISDHLETFSKLCASILRGREEVQLSVTACANGLDLAFSLPQNITPGLTADFVKAFAKTPFIRASANDEILVEREKPVVQFAGAKVPVPSGSFLQAVETVEEQIAKLVAGHLKKSKKVVDLFCGSGTFALRLAQRSKVHGVETEKPALEALVKGAGADGLKPVTTEQRDLYEAPLTIQELERFNGVCMDPPRAGAEGQARALAQSEVEKIAYVSCSPQTLARDSSILIKGGFTLDRIVPLDQFIFSPHVEVVALFTKANMQRKKSIFGRKV